MSTAYTDLTVWDDETGEQYFIDGHVNRRRALAAINHYVREACGLEDRNDQLGDVRADDVSVVHSWVRPDPVAITVPDLDGGTTSYVDDERAEWCGPTHPQAEAITVVSL
jgi:hypothetical protein